MIVPLLAGRRLPGMGFARRNFAGERGGCVFIAIVLLK